MSEKKTKIAKRAKAVPVAVDADHAPSAESVTVTLEANGRRSRDAMGQLAELGPLGALCAALFKHNEVMAALVIKSNVDVREVLSAVNRQGARQAEQIEKYQEQGFKNMVTLEELLTQRHIRDLATQSSAAKMRMLEQLFEKVNILAPTMINRWVGKKVMPEMSSPEKEMLRGFVESLTPEEFHGIIGALPPHKSAAIVALVRHFQDEAEKREAEKQKQKVTPISQASNKEK